MDDKLDQMIEMANNIHKNIAEDVWPNGWDHICSKCGKVTHYTKEQCAYYLGHGWPVCDCKKKE